MAKVETILSAKTPCNLSLAIPIGPRLKLALVVPAPTVCLTKLAQPPLLGARSLGDFDSAEME